MSQPVRPAETSSALFDELRWFIRLRWLAGTVVVLGTVVNLPWVGWSSTHAWMLGVGGAILAYNTVFHLVVRRWERTGARATALLGLAWCQILLDLLCLTGVVVWSGGISSPLLGLFVLHLVFASLLLPPMNSYICAAAAILLVAAGLRLTGQWPDGGHLLVGLGWILMLLLTAYLAGHITGDLRRRADKLRSQSRRTRAIRETAADGIIAVDEQGIIRSVNPAAERIFGYDLQEMIGRNVSLLMPEPDRSNHDRYMEDYRRTGQAKIIGIGREVEGLRKDGTVFPVDLAVSEVDLGPERIFTGILRDITERKRAEEALTRLNEELRRQQQALIQHEKMAAMGQMAAGLAHEISNPLASMDSLLQLVARRPERIGTETGEALRTQVDRISRIVRQMTDFAHPNETGWEVCPLNDVVEQSLDMIRLDHRIRHVDLVMDLAPDVGPVRLVPQSIQQVMVNLVMNAVDALDGVSEPRLAVSTRRDDGWCIVDVADNGHGIAPEHLDRIFEPFFTTKPLGRGTGLGLSISYSLVQRHGGRCQVESTAGQGTRVSVHLPGADSTSRGRDGSGDAFPDSENPTG
jgi:two-component system sensor kinase FixL